MPNGGHISCEYCVYNRSNHSGNQDFTCDIFGVETNPGTLCRAFRVPKQSHRDARKKWKLLNALEPGTVYEIDNSAYYSGNPRPVFKIIPISIK